MTTETDPVQGGLSSSVFEETKRSALPERKGSSARPSFISAELAYQHVQRKLFDKIGFNKTNRNNQAQHREWFLQSVNAVGTQVNVGAAANV